MAETYVHWKKSATYTVLRVLCEKEIISFSDGMSSYAEFKKKSLENQEVKAAYDELQPAYDIIQARLI